ncbi:MAG: hypothetical protein KatS3mg102_2213 [Planctomycetota bacterium]|nr:MAG: hypothetical protein KatS3mg102_2213 [Planctomycetota bacterium]
MTDLPIYRMKALTDIWTGSVVLEEKGGKLKERIVPDRLVPTGLLGSIRWWFEVVVRGLGGGACDPSRHQCPDHRKAPADPGHHCVACELFGCTGGARKFRFDVLDESDKIQQRQIKRGQSFQLRFTPPRPVAPEEWALLDLTLRLIARYGAMGSKTVCKPSDEPSRQGAVHHRDYGLVVIEGAPKVQRKSKKALGAYVKAPRWRIVEHGSFAWASLEHFWCVPGRYLARQQTKKSAFNRVVGRKEDKSIKERKGRRVVRWSDLLQDETDQESEWLAGSRGESKKVFSFKDPESARRTFGFVQAPDKLVEMRQRLRKKAWRNLKNDEFVKGADVLTNLLDQGGAA